MRKPLFVIIGVDNKKRFDLCLRSIRRLYGDTVDIAVGCFLLADVPHQGGTETWCNLHGFEYYEISQPWFPQKDRNLPYLCEAVALWQIYKHFFDKGYEEVYQIHSDVVLLRDILEMYRRKRVGNWSMIFPLFRCYPNGGRIIRSREEFLAYNRPKHITIPWTGHEYQDHWSNWRFTLSLTTCNPLFLNKVYERYGDEESIYLNLFKDSALCADVSYYDVMDCEGFSIDLLPPDVSGQYDLPWSYEPEEFTSYILTNSDVLLLHGQTSIDYIYNYGEDLFFEGLDKGEFLSNKYIGNYTELLSFIRRQGYKRGLIIGDPLAEVYDLLFDWEGQLHILHSWRKDPQSLVINNVDTEVQQEKLREQLSLRKDNHYFHIGNQEDVLPLLQEMDFVIYWGMRFDYDSIIHLLETAFPILNQHGLFFGKGHIAETYGENEKNKNCYLVVIKLGIEESINVGHFGVNTALRDFTDSIDEGFQITSSHAYWHSWYIIKGK